MKSSGTTRNPRALALSRLCDTLTRAEVILAAYNKQLKHSEEYMALPQFDQILYPFLSLTAEDGGISLAGVQEKIAQILELTEEDIQEKLKSGKQTKFYNRICWSKTYLIKAKLIEEKEKGIWHITDRGEKVLAENESLTVKMLREFPEFRDFSGPTRKKKISSPTVTDEEKKPNVRIPSVNIHDIYKGLNEDLGRELLEKVMQQTPDFFEKLILDLFIAMGYGGTIDNAGKCLVKSADGGVEGVIDQDALGLDRVYLQAKRYNENTTIGASAISDFFGLLDRFKANKGVFVTTSSFSDEAIETAKSLSKRIVLINGTRLVQLMIRYGVGCRVEETLYIKRTDEDYFS